jgi:ribosomal protein S18 acetylase RimI-like enzyme
MEVKIREYAQNDKRVLQSMVEALQDFVVSTDPIKRIRRMEGYKEIWTEKLLKKVEKNNGKIYFAVVNDEVVGYVAGTPRVQTSENLLEVIPTKVGTIQDLYVDRKYRGHGIGRKLVENIENYLRNSGCDSLCIEVFAANKSAHNWYKKLEYMDREIGMLKSFNN